MSILSYLGVMILEERDLTERIGKLAHHGCAEDDDENTMLSEYFEEMKGEERPDNPMERFHNFREKPCEKCEAMLALILGRKGIRKKIGMIRGQLTKLALKEAKEVSE